MIRAKWVPHMKFWTLWCEACQHCIGATPSKVADIAAHHAETAGHMDAILLQWSKTL